MTQLAQVGDFCPNESCSRYGIIQSIGSKTTIKKHGFTKTGTQRYRCENCRKTFTETKGTLFYRRRTSPEAIIETLALLAEGSRISSLSRVKGYKEDTILDWLREASKHVAEVESILFADYEVKRGQLDAMWSYVNHKGEKTNMKRQQAKENFGGQQ